VSKGPWYVQKQTHKARWMNGDPKSPANCKLQG
jgi:hypothetical protein